MISLFASKFITFEEIPHCKHIHHLYWTHYILIQNSKWYWKCHYYTSMYMVFSTTTHYLISKHLLIFWKIIYLFLTSIFKMFTIILKGGRKRKHWEREREKVMKKLRNLKMRRRSLEMMIMPKYLQTFVPL